VYIYWVNNIYVLIMSRLISRYTLCVVMCLLLAAVPMLATQQADGDVADDWVSYESPSTEFASDNADNKVAISGTSVALAVGRVCVKSLAGFIGLVMIGADFLGGDNHITPIGTRLLSWGWAVYLVGNNIGDEVLYIVDGMFDGYEKISQKDVALNKLQIALAMVRAMASGVTCVNVGKSIWNSIINVNRPGQHIFPLFNVPAGWMMHLIAKDAYNNGKRAYNGIEQQYQAAVQQEREQLYMLMAQATEGE